MDLPAAAQLENIRRGENQDGGGWRASFKLTEKKNGHWG